MLRVKAKRGPTPAHTNYNSEQRGASIGRCNRVARLHRPSTIAQRSFLPEVREFIKD